MIVPFVHAFLFAGCAGTTPADGEPAVESEAGLVEEPDGPVTILTVTVYGGTASGVVELIPATPGGPGVVYGPPAAVGMVDEDGLAELVLPAAPADAWGDPLEGTGFYVLALREVDEDGVAGAFLGVAPARVAWLPAVDEALPEAGIGWSIVAVSPSGEQRILPIEGGVGVADALAQRDTLRLGGPAILPGAHPSYALATSGGAEATEVEAVLAGGSIGQGWVLDVTQPPTDAELGEDGLFDPVAYEEVDGVEGFDPEGDEVVGVTCFMSSEAVVAWLPPVMNAPEAMYYLQHRLRPGWNAVTLSPGGPYGIAHADRLVMRTSCSD